MSLIVSYLMKFIFHVKINVPVCDIRENITLGKLHEAIFKKKGKMMSMISNGNITILLRHIHFCTSEISTASSLMLRCV